VPHFTYYTPPLASRGKFPVVWGLVDCASTGIRLLVASAVSTEVFREPLLGAFLVVSGII